MLHLTERHLNSELTVWRDLLFSSLFRGNQSITDVNHRFDLKPEVGELHTQAIDLNVQALVVARLVATPN